MRIRRLRYGSHPSQKIDLWVPRRPPTTTVVLLHGGYWRAKYSKRLMVPLAVDLARRGFAVANVEYRRLGGGGGYPSTFLDVGAAVDLLAGLDELARSRFVTCGHSAGGHLALWAAARPTLVGSDVCPTPPLASIGGAIGLAAVTDLRSARAKGVSGGVVDELLGGVDGAELEQRLALTSPAQLLPLGVPQLLVHGPADETVAYDGAERYLRLARAAGDDVTLEDAPGGHMRVIVPFGPSWRQVIATIRQWESSARPQLG